MSKIRHYLIIIISFVLLLIIIIVVWLMPDKNVSENLNSQPTPASLTMQPNPTLPRSSTSIESNHIEQTEQPQFVTGLEHLPSSLRDTDVDGEIIIDGNRQLIVTRGLRHLFDYFLTASGEESSAVIIERIEAYIRHHTPEPAASEAVEILYQYTDYLTALDDIANNYSSNINTNINHSPLLPNVEPDLDRLNPDKLDLEALQARQTQIAQLRRRLFNKDTIEAFFSQEDALENYSMAMVRIAQDDTLNDEQKRQASLDYINSLPGNSTIKRRQQDNNITELLSRTQMLKEDNASAEALYQMRASLVGEPAAKRLATLDKQDADFATRFAEYEAQKRALIVSGQQNSNSLGQLEARLFDDNERQRLAGYAAVNSNVRSSNILNEEHHDNSNKGNDSD